MTKSIIIWFHDLLLKRTKHLRGTISTESDGFLASILVARYDQTLIEVPCDPIVVNHKVIIEYGYGRYFTNISKFAQDCKYEFLRLSDDRDRLALIDVGVRVTFNFDGSDDEFMLMTLEHGQDFFYRSEE